MDFIDPTSAQLRSLAELDQDGPVTMLNLLRFRDEADYSAHPDLAPQAPVSGRAAYATYGSHVLPHLQAAGGTVVLAGDGGPTVIGPVGEVWDHVLLVRYPNVQAFLGMVMSEGYQAIVGHRTAAVADSRLIPTIAHKA